MFLIPSGWELKRSKREHALPSALAVVPRSKEEKPIQDVITMPPESPTALNPVEEELPQTSGDKNDAENNHGDSLQSVDSEGYLEAAPQGLPSKSKTSLKILMKERSQDSGDHYVLPSPAGQPNYVNLKGKEAQIIHVH